MNSITLNLEIVTPMFLHGSNRKELELRPPPFKALLRYWWRASQAETDINLLRDKESDLFGHTGRKSPLLIRIPGTQAPRKGDYQPLPHHTGKRSCPNCEDRRPNQTCKKGDKNKAYTAGERFTMKLSAENLDFYKKFLKLGFLLGGIGNRARRGFGSIRILNNCWDFKDITDLREYTRKTFNDVASKGSFQEKTERIEAKNGSKLTTHIVESTLTSTRYPVIWRIYFGSQSKNVAKNVDSLLKTIGQATHDHDNDALGYARGSKRMASPIHVTINKVDGGFFPVITQIYTNNTSQQRKQEAFIYDIIK